MTRGSVGDVLSRYVLAAREHNADVIVRITGDCPLIDPAIIDTVVAARAIQDADYANNVEPPTFPEGYDTEALTLACLQRLDAEATRPYEREHVTARVREHPDDFRVAHVACERDLSWMRLTVDVPADLVHVAAVLDALPPPRHQISTPSWRRSNATRRSRISPACPQGRAVSSLSGTLRETSRPHHDRHGSRPVLAGPTRLTRYHTDVQQSSGSAGRGRLSGVLRARERVPGVGRRRQRYIDYPCALGPVILGYGDEAVDAAVVDAFTTSAFSLGHRLEVEVAELLVDMVPGAEMVRFLKTGSEATTAAVRLARAATGHEHVAMCGYHGWHDWCIGQTTRNAGVPLASRHSPTSGRTTTSSCYRLSSTPTPARSPR